MKRTDGFDARRLRPSERRSLGARAGNAFGLLMVIVGILAMGTGAASFVESIRAVVDISLEREAAVALITMGIVLLLIGGLVRSRVRRRLSKPNGLTMSPRLTKRR